MCLCRQCGFHGRPGQRPGLGRFAPRPQSWPLPPASKWHQLRSEPLRCQKLEGKPGGSSPQRGEAAPALPGWCRAGCGERPSCVCCVSKAGRAVSTAVLEQEGSTWLIITKVKHSRHSQAVPAFLTAQGCTGLCLLLRGGEPGQHLAHLALRSQFCFQAVLTLPCNAHF